MTELDRAYMWCDRSLLETAFNHSSWCYENRGNESYERLEWLGDAILEAIVAVQVFESMPLANEGELSKQQAELVNTKALAKAASRLGLDMCVRLGRGVPCTTRILANVMEAVIGAAFIDGGMRAARVIAAAGGIV